MNNKLSLEIIWWITTLIVTAIIILPIYLAIGTDYLFYIENIVAIVIFITLSRWILMLRHTLFGWNKKIKVFILFAMIPLFFICYDNLVDFQSFIDEQDIYSMLNILSTAEKPKLAKYIRYEYLFFGTGAMICIVIIPFRMVISIWKQVNKGVI